MRVLNEYQREAVRAREGAFRVLATAGSGKTTVLVERVKELLASGERIEDILGLTFTVEAAENMEKRLGLKVPKAARGGFRTFHSFGLNLVRSEARFLPYRLAANPIRILGEDDKPITPSTILNQAMSKSGIPRKEFKDVQAYISRTKRERITPEQAKEGTGPYPQYVPAYELYEKYLRSAGLLDYDAMVVEAVNLLERVPEVKDRWSIRWVMCDEGQDTDDLQFRLLQLVSEKHGNIFVVGDACQALYGFRGARPENMMDFGKWFPGAKTIILPVNYRSTQEICRICREMAPLENELTRNIQTPNGDGPPLELRMYASANQEAESVLCEATKDPGNSAVLARTNQQLGAFETMCVENGIKFHLLGRSGFWHQPEIRSLVRLADFAASDAAPDGYSQELVAPVRQAARKVPASEGLQMIVGAARLEHLYSDEDYEDDDNFALNNIRTVVKIAERFPTLREFTAHARKASHASRKAKNAVTLSTVHQAKGLEWKNVFVVGVQDGLMPHKRGDLEEERRIFFVALSRAAWRLRFSFAGTPSSFLAKYLTPEIQKQIAEAAEKVESLVPQARLFDKQTASAVG